MILMDAQVPGLARSSEGGHGNPLHYSLPGKSPWTEEPGRPKSKELDTTERLSTQHGILSYVDWCLALTGHEEYSGVTAEKLVLHCHANNLTFWDHMKYYDPVCVV